MTERTKRLERWKPDTARCEEGRSLARTLRGEGVSEAAERARAFVAEFIRPQGLDQPSTPLLAGALEELAATPRKPHRPSVPPPQDWLDRLANELEAIFNIRRESSLKTRPAKASAKQARSAQRGAKRARRR